MSKVTAYLGFREAYCGIKPERCGILHMVACTLKLFLKKVKTWWKWLVYPEKGFFLSLLTV